MWHLRFAYLARYSSGDTGMCFRGVDREDFRTIAIIDEYTRECPAIEVYMSLLWWSGVTFPRKLLHYELEPSGISATPGGLLKVGKYTEEQSIAVLREAEAGACVAALYRKYGMSCATCFDWKAKYAGITVGEIKWLKGLDIRHFRFLLAYPGLW